MAAPATFFAKDLSVKRIKQPTKLPPLETLKFGAAFSDHMLLAEWNEEKGWAAPEIKPLENLTLHPACKALHYSMECFEGMKAFCGADGEVRLFRPDMNMARLRRSCERLGLPTFDEKELLECIKVLMCVDTAFVPPKEGFSLYLRPTVIGTTPNLGVSRPLDAMLYVICSPVGPYFPQGLKPLRLFVDEEHVRAWPGGVGNVKAGGNYAPTIVPMKEAAKHNCSQVLYTISLGGNDDHHTFVSEAGAMNMFFLWKKKSGQGMELATPPLDGTILPGVTRDSVLAICREWNEFEVSERPITIAEIQEAHKEGRIKEMFACGTACGIAPINGMARQGHAPMDIDLDIEDSSLCLIRILNHLRSIQYGKIESPWNFPVKEGTELVDVKLSTPARGCIIA